jgi:Secretion system C-terminal sorting domain
MKKILSSVAIVLALGAQAQFTAGNVAVARIGDGTTALSGNSTSVSILQFTKTTANQAAPVSTINLATTTAKSRLTLSGTTQAEGQLSLAQNRNSITIFGYDQPTGVPSTGGTTNQRDGNKIIASIDAAGVVTYYALEAPLLSGATRSAVTDDGTAFWATVSNSSSSVYYLTAAAPTTTTATNFNSDGSGTRRGIGIFKGQLYEIDNGTNLKTSNPALPTASGASTGATVVSGSTVFGALNSINPVGFVFLDADPIVNWNSTGYDLLYIASGNGGLYKLFWNGTAWVMAGTTPYSSATEWGTLVSTQLSGITGDIIGGRPVLYALTGNGGSGSVNNSLISITDNQAYNVAMTTPTNIVLATAGANYQFKGVAFVPGTVLPISITSFTGSLINEKATLSWATSAEINAKEFVVEKSNDGTNFSALTVVAAKNRNSSYTANDIALEKGVNYYRLKLVDKDGSFSYSKTIVINVSKKASNELSIFPNPVVNSMAISHSKAINGSVIKIVTASGKIAAQYNVAKDATQTSIDVSKLVTGSYFITYVNNGVPVTKTFIK